MRLLIVEDNVEFAGFLAKGLRAAGYEADVLSSIDDAGIILRTTQYAAQRRLRFIRSVAWDTFSGEK
jgi:DNA-binding response OmpR family regulator